MPSTIRFPLLLKICSATPEVARRKGRALCCLASIIPLISIHHYSNPQLQNPLFSPETVEASRRPPTHPLGPQRSSTSLESFIRMLGYISKELYRRLMGILERDDKEKFLKFFRDHPPPKMNTSLFDKCAR